MMLIDVQIPFCPNPQIEAAMFGKQLQHVVEEANSSENLVLRVPIEHQVCGDLRLRGVSIEGGFSHRTVSNSFTFSSTAIAPWARRRATNSSRRGLFLCAMPTKLTSPAA